MKNIILLLVVFLSINFSSFSQNVAISTTTAAPNASAMLDIVSTTKGLLIPRMTVAQRTAIATPAQGLMVYQTDAGSQGAGFYFYNGGSWAPWSTNGGSWGLTGNPGTTAGTNFIGTTDAVNFSIRTNNIERLRIFSTGAVAINTVGVNATSTFFVSGGANNAIEGYGTGANDAIKGSNTGAGAGVAGNSSNNAGAGVFAFSNATSGYGLYAWSSGTSGKSVYAYADGATAFGVQSYNNHLSGTGVIASGNSVAGSYLVGGSGGAFKGVTGLYAVSSSTAGNGLLIAGNNLSTSSFASGSGATIKGETYGTIGLGSNAALSTGVVGVGNNLGSVYTVASTGSGGAFSGLNYGAYGNATITGAGNDAVDRAAFIGNYVSGGTTVGTVYIGARIGGVHYKILGPAAGSVSTTMKTRNGERILFAPESPENWFFDVGEVQLVNGKAIVKLDPMFIDCLSDSKPFKVFVQGGENTMGSIRISRDQTDKSFIVEDLGGASNGIVQYSIYGIWKGKENLRFPEYTPEQQIKYKSEESTTPKAGNIETINPRKLDKQN